MKTSRILFTLLLLSALLNASLALYAGYQRGQVNRYREECGDRTDAPNTPVTPDVVQP